MRDVAAALWLDSGNVPWEAVELWLCRDVYHCTPSQLRREAWADIVAHLEVMAAEQRARR